MRVDVLMITYDRPPYVRRSLQALLNSLDDETGVWLWHNGQDESTLQVTREFAKHEQVVAFHHSAQNLRLTAPTNWMWEGTSADLVGKVDDDCLVHPDWIRTLRQAHADVPHLGAVGSWRFLPEDYREDLAKKKIIDLPGGHRVLQNLWVQGSGYLVKTGDIRRQGLLADGQSFSSYCIELAKAGRVNGWYFPFIPEDHMDDPRSLNTLLRTDEDLLQRLPLSAVANGVRTLADWERQMRDSALIAQTASLDPRAYSGWRLRRRNVRRRIQRRLGLPSSW